MKKKLEVLKPWHEKFIAGFIRAGFTESYANDKWDELVGFADYCLSGETKIQTDRGILTIKEIVDSRIECSVLSWNNGVYEYLPILQWHDRGIQDVFCYTIGDFTITCTPDHEFLTREGFLPIESIFTLQKDLVI